MLNIRLITKTYQQVGHLLCSSIRGEHWHYTVHVIPNIPKSVLLTEERGDERSCKFQRPRKQVWKHALEVLVIPKEITRHNKTHCEWEEKKKGKHLYQQKQHTKQIIFFKNWGKFPGRKVSGGSSQQMKSHFHQGEAPGIATSSP